MISRRYFTFLLLFITKISTAQIVDDNILFIVGSTSAAKLIEASEERFHQKTGIRVLIRALGSDKGIISQAKELSDIAVISRYLSKDEQKNWPELTQVTFAQDAIVFLVNKNNPITSITTQQVQNIFTQNAPKWPNTDKAIQVLSKDIGHGTHDSFLDFFDLESMKLPINNTKNELLFKKNGSKELFSHNPIRTYNKINQAFGLIYRIEDALAYESLGAYQVFIKDQEFVNTKLLNLDGIPPIINGKINQKYPFKRSFNIIINRTISTKAQKYINFLLSDEGQEILLKNGFIKLPNE